MASAAASTRAPGTGGRARQQARQRGSERTAPVGERGGADKRTQRQQASVAASPTSAMTRTSPRRRLASVAAPAGGAAAPASARGSEHTSARSQPASAAPRTSARGAGGRAWRHQRAARRLRRAEYTSARSQRASAVPRTIARAGRRGGTCGRRGMADRARPASERGGVLLHGGSACATARGRRDLRGSGGVLHGGMAFAAVALRNGGAAYFAAAACVTASAAAVACTAARSAHQWHLRLADEQLCQMETAGFFPTVKSAVSSFLGLSVDVVSHIRNGFLNFFSLSSLINLPNQHFA